VRAGRAGADLSAVFLDRDGVINVKAPEGEHVTSWERFEFLPGALKGLRLLAEAGRPVVIVTNQRGIARGHMSEADLADIHARMSAAVAEAGGRIDAIYHCPHEGGCECRKPGTALFERAARDLDLDLEASAVVGDRAHDMDAAARIGALRVLVGGVSEAMPPVAHRAEDLASAARWLLDHGLRASAISE
jgi:D-glycero-D-manno-heptose 1,7-bisphosphate phosphatase